MYAMHTALNPAIDWSTVQDHFLGRDPEAVVVDGFLSPKALQLTLACVRQSTVFFDGRTNYMGGYMKVRCVHMYISIVAGNCASVHA